MRPLPIYFVLMLLCGCSNAPIPEKPAKDDLVRVQYGAKVDRVLLSEICENEKTLFVHYHPPGSQDNLLAMRGLTDEQIQKLKSGSKLAIGDFNAGKDQGYTKEIPYEFVPKNRRVYLSHI